MTDEWSEVLREFDAQSKMAGSEDVYSLIEEAEASGVEGCCMRKDNDPKAQHVCYAQCLVFQGDESLEERENRLYGLDEPLEVVPLTPQELNFSAESYEMAECPDSYGSRLMSSCQHVGISKNRMPLSSKEESKRPTMG